MTPQDIEQVKSIIKDELSNIFKLDRIVLDKKVQILDARNIQLGRTTGTKIGTATDQKLGFFNATPIVPQTSGADLQNSVTVGGTDDIIGNFTDLSTYANDAATIRNDLYQLARKLKQVNDALRDFGFLT